MKSSSPIIAFVAGIAVGSILGVLFAPDKGTKTRRKLKDKVAEAAENLEQKIKKVDKIDADLIRKGKSTISHINKNIVEM